MSSRGFCIEAALWSTNDEGGHGIEHIADEALAKLTADCKRFQPSRPLEDEELGKLPVAVHAFST